MEKSIYMEKQIKILKELILSKIKNSDSSEIFDFIEINKIENILEYILTDHISTTEENLLLKKKVNYLLERIPEFLAEGTEYSKMFHQYDFNDD
jgi:hypothetical protein